MPGTRRTRSSVRQCLFPADDLRHRFGTRTVSTFQAKYLTSLGRFCALGSDQVISKRTESATYGEIVRYSRDVTVLKMKQEYHRARTNLVLVGASRDAHLVGHAEAGVATGGSVSRD